MPATTAQKHTNHYRTVTLENLMKLKASRTRRKKVCEIFHELGVINADYKAKFFSACLNGLNYPNCSRPVPG
jgi:hypothetical protein